MSRGNRRWVLIGGMADGSAIGKVYHYVERFLSRPDEKPQTACGKLLPESYGLFWGPKHERCKDCLAARKKDAGGKS